MSIEVQIKTLLICGFQPEVLEIYNESHKHKGHLESSESGETHFKILIVSKEFSNRTRIQNHKLIYVCLEGLINNPIHALSIKAFSPEGFKSQTFQAQED